MLNKYESVLSKMNEILDMLRLSNHPIHLVSKGENYHNSLSAYNSLKGHLYMIRIINLNYESPWNHAFTVH